MIEYEVFKRRTILFDRLETFGFLRINNCFVIEKVIYDGMLCRVKVTPSGEVIGKVYDTDLGEEYVNYRNESAEGAFVVGVRSEFEAFLKEIAEACSVEKLYIGAQANRINARIGAEYGVSPEFMWAKFPNFGVYRNPSSRKWFAIIMNIAKNKLISDAEGEAEVMNLKLDDLVPGYLGSGVYPCYHMNQKSWVSVLLDDAVSDDRIAEMIRISYENTVKSKKKK